MPVFTSKFVTCIDGEEWGEGVGFDSLDIDPLSSRMKRCENALS